MVHFIDAGLVALDSDLEGEGDGGLYGVELGGEGLHVVEAVRLHAVLVGVVDVEIEVASHFLHEQMALKDVHLVLNARSHHDAVELHEGVGASSARGSEVVAVILHQHHSLTQVDVGLGGQIEVSERQAHDDGNDEPLPIEEKDIKDVTQGQHLLAFLLLFGMNRGIIHSVL